MRTAFLLASLALLLMPSCGARFDVERRETPVHVWLTVPAFERNGGTLEGEVNVGPYRVVHGPVVFPPGQPTVALPSLYIRSGGYRVSGSLQNGRVRGNQTVTIEGESWIQLVVSGTALSISHHEEQPNSRGVQ